MFTALARRLTDTIPQTLAMNGFVLFALPSLLCFIGSFFYFTMEPKASSAGRALLVSLHGLTVGGLNIYTVLQGSNPRTSETRELMFLVCWIVPPALMAASLRLFKGPQIVHIFLLPIGYCYLQILAIGLFVYLNAKM